MSVSAPRTLESFSTREDGPVGGLPGRRWPGREEPPAPGAEGGVLLMLLEALMVHRRLLLGSLLTSLVLGWATIFLWPRQYGSEAKLFVQIGRESVSLDPTATTSETLTLQKTQEEEINSVLEVLNSRSIVEDVVDRLGVDSVLSGYLPGAAPQAESSASRLIASARSAFSDTLHSALLTVGLKDEVGDRELAVLELQKKLSIYAPKKAAVITIASEAASPQMAQAIVEEIIDCFLATHGEAYKTDGSQQFFTSLSGEAASKLQTLLDRRGKIMKQSQIASVDSKRDSLISQRGDVDRDRLATLGELEQVLGELEDLRKKHLETNDVIVAERQQQSSGLWNTMRDRVYVLEIDEQNLAAQFTDSHPKLVQIREQLTGARKILDSIKSQSIGENTQPNPIKITLKQTILRHESRIVGLKAVIAEKQAQLDEIDRQISELLDLEIELVQLDREILVAEDSLAVLREKQEEARVISELQARRISNIHVFQPPSFIERPVSPNKKVVLVAFATLGLAGGLGLVLMREGGLRVLRTAEQVERELDRPVLAETPAGSRPTPSRNLINSAAFDTLEEACRSLLAELMLTPSPGAGPRGRLVGIMSLGDGADAGVVAAGVAVASGRGAGQQTTLVDADMSNPNVTRIFQLNGAPGAAELLAGEASLGDCLQTPQLDGLLAGRLRVVANTSPLALRRLTADHASIERAIEEVRRENDLVIVALPPADRADPMMSLAGLLDQLVLVVDSEKTERAAAQRLMRRLDLAGVEVAGFLLTNVRRYVPGWIRRLLS